MRYWLYRQKYLGARWMRHKTPVDISLELSSMCNLRCQYCYHADGKPPFQKQHMSLTIAEKVINEAADLGVNSLKFNFRGEATLNYAFRDILTLAKKKASGSTFIDRILNTNFNFPNHRADYFNAMSTLTKVKVSCDSFRPHVLETQRAGCNAALVYDNLDTFYNWPNRRDSGTKLVIQAVRTKLNQHEDLVGYARQRWPDAIVNVRDMVTGRSDKAEPLSVKDRGTGRQSCIQAHARMIILADGRVSPCCPAFKGDLIIGDVTKQSLKEIFNSEAARALRSDLKTGAAFVKEPCKSCPSFESYAGYKAPRDS